MLTNVSLTQPPQGGAKPGYADRWQLTICTRTEQVLWGTDAEPEVKWLEFYGSEEVAIAMLSELVVEHIGGFVLPDAQIMFVGATC